MNIMKIELKHLAGYLPYGVKIKTNNMVREMVCDRNINDEEAFKIKVSIFNVITGIGHKLVLRPLSDLTKEIEVNGEKINFPKMFFPIDEFLMAFGYTSQGESEVILEYSKIEELCFNIYFWQKLYEWHFDIHGLIERDLAIDINTLDKK